MNVDGGRITIDDQDIARYTQNSVRRAVSYVPQDPQMLHRSIAENIWYGRPGDIEMDLITRVGKAAHVEEFVRELPEGYDTVVGERGLKLSGGQRQRVAIAQAMLKAAPVLILDEATSSLDSESERYVQEALWRLMARSHRPGGGPPAIDNCPPRPHRRHRRRQSCRGGNAQRAAPHRARRYLPAPVGAPIGRFPERLTPGDQGLMLEAETLKVLTLKALTLRASPGPRRPGCLPLTSSRGSDGCPRPSGPGTTTGSTDRRRRRGPLSGPRSCACP